MRRKITKAGAGILAAALVMSTLPCGGLQAQAAAKKPSLSATSASLSVGSKLTLKVQNKAKGTTAKWKTSKKSVASVTQKGVVSGVKAGSATITCTLTTKAKKKTSLKCRVSVSANVEVRTQTQLNKALANKNVKNITIRTAARKTYTIAAGDYSAKGLIVKAPNAEVYNSGAFRAVTIKAIKADTWHENAKGNTIKVTAPQAHIIVAEGAEADSVRVMREGADVKIDVQGKASSVSVEEKATVAVAVTGAVDAVTVGAASDVRMDVDGSVGAVDVRKASTVTADVDGAIGAVAVSEKSALIFTGKTASIPITVAAEAAGTSVSASAPVRVDTSADVSLELQKGAEGSAVNVNEKASVSVTGDAESATVTVAAGAAGSSVSASVPVSVDTSADVSVELQKGAEGSTVKTQDDSLTVGMDNKTDNAVKVETPSGEKTVNAGASQSVTGTTAQTVTPSAPSTAPNQEVTYPAPSPTPSEPASYPKGVQYFGVLKDSDVSFNDGPNEEDTTKRTRYNQGEIKVTWDGTQCNVELPSDGLYYFRSREEDTDTDHAWIALRIDLTSDFCSGASLQWGSNKEELFNYTQTGLELELDKQKTDKGKTIIWWIAADNFGDSNTLIRYIGNGIEGADPIEIKAEIKDAAKPVRKNEVIVKELPEGCISAEVPGWYDDDAAQNETVVTGSPIQKAQSNQKNIKADVDKISSGGIHVKVTTGPGLEKWKSTDPKQSGDEKPWIALAIDADALMPADKSIEKYSSNVLYVKSGEAFIKAEDDEAQKLAEIYGKSEDADKHIVIWWVDASKSESTLEIGVGSNSGSLIKREIVVNIGSSEE